MQKTLVFTVNGQRRSLTTDTRRPLLEVLREDFGLTGTKYGCGEGQCLACTVLVDGKPRASCSMSVEAAEGREILTIEGLATNGKLHSVQEAFLTEGAFQCGYCTPGMILGTVGLLREKPKASEKELIEGLQRHLCRCCNYPGIASAVKKAVVHSTNL
jgi:carbon-monoxide dehydrogenase small subunit